MQEAPPWRCFFFIRKADYMELHKLHADLDHLYGALLSHPLLRDDPNELEAFRGLYPILKEGCTGFDSFVTAASDLTGFFRDGHTNIELPYSPSDLCLPIPCAWQEDALLTQCGLGDIPAGTQILGVEGKPALHILQSMSRRIPHENLYLVKSRMTAYPYQNYHLFSKLNLTWLFGEKEAYRVDFLRGEQVDSRTIPLSPYSGFLDFPDENDFLSWDIQQGAALLRLDSCICNDAYLQALDALAAACRAENATSLTLDLSHNMGGSSAVIDPFLSHTDTPGFRRYEMIDYRSGQTVTSRSQLVPNPRAEHLLPKKLYCIVGNHTFSSARTFAVTLKDNGLATILGQPTGGKPSSYGMPCKDALPHTGIRFRVSQALFLRPNAQLDEEDTLTPDQMI